MLSLATSLIHGTESFDCSPERRSSASVFDPRSLLFWQLFGLCCLRFIVKRLLLLLTASLSVAATAQTAIDGTVRNQDDKAVISATVILQRAEGSVAQQTTSDSAGHFRFSVVDAGAYT